MMMIIIIIIIIIRFNSVGLTDTTNLIVAFSQFCDTPKKKTLRPNAAGIARYNVPSWGSQTVGRFADPYIHFACLSVRRSDNTDVTFTPDCWRTVSEIFRNSHVVSHCPVTPQSQTLHVLTPPASQAIVAT